MSNTGVSCPGAAAVQAGTLGSHLGRVEGSTAAVCTRPTHLLPSTVVAHALLPRCFPLHQNPPSDGQPACAAPVPFQGLRSDLGPPRRPAVPRPVRVPANRSNTACRCAAPPRGAARCLAGCRVPCSVCWWPAGCLGPLLASPLPNLPLWLRLSVACPAQDGDPGDWHDRPNVQAHVCLLRPGSRHAGHAGVRAVGHRRQGKEHLLPRALLHDGAAWCCTAGLPGCGGAALLAQRRHHPRLQGLPWCWMHLQQVSKQPRTLSNHHSASPAYRT